MMWLSETNQDISKLENRLLDGYHMFTRAPYVDWDSPCLGSKVSSHENNKEINEKSWHAAALK
jgi:hypothetical protein